MATAKKAPTKKAPTKKTSTKPPAPKAKVKAKPSLTANQSYLLKTLAPQTKFTRVGVHHKTQQALIERDLAVTDASGKLIKATALGRKVAKSL